MKVIKHGNCILRDLKMTMKVESPRTRNFFFLPIYYDLSWFLQLREGKHPENPQVSYWGSGQELGSNFPFSNSHLSREKARQVLALIGRMLARQSLRPKKWVKAGRSGWILPVQGKSQVGEPGKRARNADWLTGRPRVRGWDTSSTA